VTETRAARSGSKGEGHGHGDAHLSSDVVAQQERVELDAEVAGLHTVRRSRDFGSAKGVGVTLDVEAVPVNGTRRRQNTIISKQRSASTPRNQS
jgi:hypothetical protein